MHCLCKALANGHPIAALIGNERAREGAAKITASGTYWLAGGPMAAALANLDVLEADGSAAMHHMQVIIRRRWCHFRTPPPPPPPCLCRMDNH
jgi:4-aminobutyrate aminotransferase-like enzyme